MRGVPLTLTSTASSDLPVSFTTTTPLVCTTGGQTGRRSIWLPPEYVL